MAKTQPKSGNRKSKRATAAVDRSKDKQKARAVGGLLKATQKLHAQRQFVVKVLATLVDKRMGGAVELDLSEVAEVRDLGIEMEGTTIRLKSVASKSADMTMDQAQAAVVDGMTAMRDLNDPASEAAPK